MIIGNIVRVIKFQILSDSPPRGVANFWFQVYMEHLTSTMKRKTPVLQYGHGEYVKHKTQKFDYANGEILQVLVGNWHLTTEMKKQETRNKREETKENNQERGNKKEEIGDERNIRQVTRDERRKEAKEKKNKEKSNKEKSKRDQFKDQCRSK